MENDPHPLRVVASPCHDVPMSDDYIAGVCNIGKAEVRQRLITSFIGLGFALAGASWLLSTDAPRAARWSLLFPLLVWAVGLVQARRRFCVAYGILGTFNFGKLGTVSRVSDPDFRRADRITVLKLGGLSLAYALAATLGFVLLPA